MMSYLSVLVALSVVYTASAGTYSPYFPCPTLFDYYPHPSNCAVFYRCFWGSAYEFNCPAGTYWSQRLRTCDHAYNNPCVYNYGASSTIVDSRTTVHSDGGYVPAAAPVVTDTAVVNDGYGYAAGYQDANAYWPASGYNGNYGNGAQQDSWAAQGGYKSYSPWFQRLTHGKKK